MSKYDALWSYVSEKGINAFSMTFDEIESVCGLPIDHSFLSFKKELEAYGYCVGKISMKNRTVAFVRLDS